MTAQHIHWPNIQTVAHLVGSLPMGGIVQNTPVFAFAKLPVHMPFSKPHQHTPTRHDIPLADQLAFTIDRVVTDEEADWLVAASEVFGYRDEAPGIATPPGMRMNKTVHWIAPSLVLDNIFARIQPLLPPQIDGCPLATSLSHRLNMYRYDRNDVFNRHIDGDWPGYGLDHSGADMVEWPSVRSKLTMLLYLNGSADGVRGGQTRLIARDGGTLDIAPQKGNALFFRHGMNPQSVPHEGRIVVSSVAKYVARINVLYEERV